MTDNLLRKALLAGKQRPRNPGGGSPVSYRGDGYEFAELRAYVPGDDPRRLDWAATARAGGLQTRVILEDVALTFAACIDHSKSMHMGRRRPLFEAAREALGAWYAAAESDDRCVRIEAGHVVPATAMRGIISARLCANVPPRGEASVVKSLGMARAALPRGSALLIISDFYEIRREHRTLLMQAALRFDCTALIACDPWRDDLPLRGFVRFKDAETGDVCRMFLGKAERRRYHAAVAERESMLHDYFRQSGWRTGTLEEKDGSRSLMRAFGLR